MALLGLALFFVSTAFTCELPFSNSKGIPFSLQFEQPYVSGFEVDEYGDYFFSGGNGIIRKLSGKDSKILFTVTVPKLVDAKIGIVGPNLWAVSKMPGSKARLVCLNGQSGVVLKDTVIVFERSLGIGNGGYFLDGFLIYSFISKPPNMNFIKINLGTLTYASVNNMYDLSMGPDSLVYKLPTFLGMSDSSLVFIALAGTQENGKEKIKIGVSDRNGILLSSKEEALGSTEMMYSDIGNNVMRTRNGKVYLLRKKTGSNKAVILTISLK